MSALRGSLFALFAAAACSSDPMPPGDTHKEWRLVFDAMPGAILRVVGKNSRDVYAVGADADGNGPLAIHFDGERWKRIALPGITGDLWWVEIVGDDDVRMVGEGGMVLHYKPSTGAVTKVNAPTSDVLFGVWGSSPTNAWYVGGQVGLNQGVVFHDDGNMIATPTPGPTATSSAAFFKVYGFGNDGVWMVGQRGSTLFFDGHQFQEPVAPLFLPLMGIHGRRADRVFAVGGSSSGVLLAWDGTKWIDETPGRIAQMIGVWATSDEDAYAVGFNGHVMQRSASGWAELPDTIPTFRDLHAVWVDDQGGIWMAGGQLSANPPTEGVLVYYGPEIATTIEP